MIIGLCCDIREDYTDNNTDIKYCHLPTKKTIATLSKLLSKIGYETVVIDKTSHLVEFCHQNSVDLVFPIYSSSGGNGQQVWIPATLERNKIPYVGSPARSVLLTGDKYISKLLARQSGIPIAHCGTVIDYYDHKSSTPENITYPCIVKPRYQSDSRGVFLARTREEFEKKASEIWTTYNEPVLYETYLPGQEITVTICENNNEPIVLGMAEIVDIDGNVLSLYSFENKHQSSVVKRTPRVSHIVTRQIENHAKKLFKLFECRDYCRIDFRMDERAIPHFLEATPTPSLPLSASFFMGASLAGISAADTLRLVVSNTCSRYGLKAM